MSKTESIPKLSFIGIGMPKCGTSWVAETLSHHPKVYIPPEKEINFFNEKYWGKKDNIAQNYGKGFRWYNKFFKKAPIGSCTGEFSVTYMADPIALKRIRKSYPSIKIIICLRKPGDMIQSLYWWFKNTSTFKFETNTFDEAVQKNLKQECRFWLGKYSKMLKNVYKYFPPKNVHIILLDEIVNNPQHTYSNLCKFLKINSNVLIQQESKRINPSIEVRSKLFFKLIVKVVLLLKKGHATNLYNFIKTNLILKKIYKCINTKRSKYPKMNISTKINLDKKYKQDILITGRLIQKDLSIWLQ